MGQWMCIDTEIAHTSGWCVKKYKHDLKLDEHTTIHDNERSFTKAIFVAGLLVDVRLLEHLGVAAHDELAVLPPDQSIDEGGLLLPRMALPLARLKDNSITDTMSNCM